MIAIKVMKQGDSWLGEIRCPTVPRVGEVVELKSRKSYKVLRVNYEWGDDDTSHPFIVLEPNPV